MTGEQPLSVMISAVTKVRREGGRNRKEKTEGLREGGIMGGSKGRREEKEGIRKEIGYQCRTVFLQGDTVVYYDILCIL